MSNHVGDRQGMKGKTKMLLQQCRQSVLGALPRIMVAGVEARKLHVWNLFAALPIARIECLANASSVDFSLWILVKGGDG